MESPLTRMQKMTDELHGGQKRADGTTNALHVRRVSRFLMEALAQSGETPHTDAAIALECAALGHDLLEDTPVTKEQIEDIAGPQALVWITGMTNTWGDGHAEPYVQQIISSSEEVRLIKLADLCDNTFHASYSAHMLGAKWMREYFLPIIDPMREAVSATRFERFPKTAAFLIATAKVARAHLQESLDMLDSQ